MFPPAERRQTLKSAEHSANVPGCRLEWGNDAGGIALAPRKSG
jgi:hypothetical protein